MAQPRHKGLPTRTWPSRLLRISVPVVVLAAVATGAAVVSHGPERVTTGPARVATGILVADPDFRANRVLRASRDESARAPLMVASAATAQTSGQVREIKPKVRGSKYLTTALNVWTGPGERFTFLTVLSERTKVSVTGNVNGAWAEIVRDGKSRWVKRDYLSNQRPEPVPEVEPPPAPVAPPEVIPGAAPQPEETEATVEGISGAPCASGSSVESGLTADAIRVHRAVCAQFPQVTSYGGLRSDGEHGQGRALDVMISGSTGTAIADWVRANSSALGVSEVLWAQQIWTVQRGSEGWRSFSDRGSATANHYDHVHVTVYGNSGG